MVRLSDTFLRTVAFDHSRAKRRGHRGVAIETTLIALIVAFTTFQLFLVIGGLAH